MRVSKTKPLEPFSRFLHVIFCDDIRQEVDGKATIVGAYQDIMKVGSFPVFLPKLGLYVTAATPGDRPFQKMQFRLLKGDAVMHGFAINVPEVEVPNEQSDESRTVMEACFATLFGPIEIDAPCQLRVELETEDTLIQSRVLDVRGEDVPQTK